MTRRALALVPLLMSGCFDWNGLVGLYHPGAEGDGGAPDLAVPPTMDGAATPPDLVSADHPPVDLAARDLSTPPPPPE